MRRTAASALWAGSLAVAVAVAGLSVPAATAATSPTTSSACPEGAVPPSPFTDVPAGSVDVDCLVWWGITGGVSATTYGTGTVSRGQMASFLARSVVRGGGVVPAAPDAFRDDNGSAHEAAANALHALNIVAGSGNGTFAPTAPVRRDQMASFLVRTAEHLLGRQLASTSGAFPDDDGNVHEAAIDKVAEAGITAGKSDGSYDPGGLVTRTQMASFLVRTLDVVVRDRLRLVRVQPTGVDPASVPAMILVEGPTVRPLPPGGTVAVHAGAQLFAPPVSVSGELRLPAASPLPVGDGRDAVSSVDVPYGPGDARVSDSENSAAQLAYLQHWFVGPAAVQPQWTGSVGRCDAGSTSQAWRSAQLDAVNAARGLVGLTPVREDLAWSAKAQETALVMAAQGSLSHDPPSTWRCWTQNADEAAGRSNLALGFNGVPAVVGYLEDPGAGNAVVGHRRWILDRRSQRIGFGDVHGENGVDAGAMWVIGDETTSPSDHVVTWPAEGQFPYALIGDTGRWSVSAPDVDFRSAAVTATVGGAPVEPVVEHRDAFGYGGEGAVVFAVPGATPYRAVTVTVTAPQPDGTVFEHTWTSTLVR